VGACLALAGWRPLIVEGAGLRLQGAGHPAFLAAFAMVGSYAALIEFLRAGWWRDAALLAMNVVILLLTGARAPLAITAVVIGLSLVFAPSPGLPMVRRWPLLLGGVVALVVLALLSGELADLRVFTLLATEADNLSGRDEIWPLFRAARNASPWVGWGMGAGKMLVAVDRPLALRLGTSAAHNEYLRLGVDGGYLGLGLLVLLFMVWGVAHLRHLRGSDRFVTLLVLIGLAVHSYTDNTLIATTASVLFAWITAVFVRGTREAQARDHPERENALS